MIYILLPIFWAICLLAYLGGGISLSVALLLPIALGMLLYGLIWVAVFGTWLVVLVYEVYRK